MPLPVPEAHVLQRVTAATAGGKRQTGEGAQNVFSSSPMDVTQAPPSDGALPLLDTQLDEPGMREHVNSLILAEMEAMAASGAADEASYLSRLPPLPPPTACRT